MRSSTVRCWRLAGVLLLIALVAGGCPKKTPPPSGTELGPGSGGFGSQGLGEGALPPSKAGGKAMEERVAGVGGEGGPLQDIHFDYDSFELTSEAGEILRANAEWLQRNSQSKLEVEGHCDERGTVEYNLALGAKRAKAARDYIVTLGVPAARISTISYGEELPLCRESNESCWQQNRRAHFLVVDR